MIQVWRLAIEYNYLLSNKLNKFSLSIQFNWLTRTTTRRTQGFSNDFYFSLKKIIWHILKNIPKTKINVPYDKICQYMQKQCVTLCTNYPARSVGHVSQRMINLFRSDQSVVIKICQYSVIDCQQINKGLCLSLESPGPVFPQTPPRRASRADGTVRRVVVVRRASSGCVLTPEYSYSINSSAGMFIKSN